MADSYDALAARLGLPIARIPDWRRMATAAPAPGPATPVVPSYEGATLQGFMPSAPAPAGPPRPPTSYEGASLQSMAPSAPSGVHLADPRRPGPGEASKPAFRPATGDNLAPAPAAVSPKVMAQMKKVADNSDAAQKGVKTAVDESDRAKNLEGATFADGTETPGVNPYGAGGGPVLVDKGGRRPGAWQVSEGMDLGDDAKHAVGDANERARLAGDLEYQAGTSAAEFERGYLERHQQASQKFAAEEGARADRYASQVDSHMGKLDELRGQIREAKVDPFGGSDSSFSRFTSTLAIALGAFASKNGENAGLEAVKHRIATNIREQEEGVRKIERGAAGEQNFLAQLKQTHGDIEAAKGAAYIAYLESAKSELAKNLGDPSVADPRLLAGYERLNAKLDDELVARTAHFKGITEDRVVRHDVNAQPRYVGGATTEAKHDARYVSEAYEKSGIPAALSELQTIDRTVDAMGDGDIPGVGAIVGKIPNVLMSDRAVAGRQAVQSIKNSIGNARFGGAISDGEASKLEAEVDGAKDSASLRRTIQSFRQKLHHRRDNIAAGASSQGNALYEARGGSVRSVPLNKPSTPHIKEAK